MKNMLILIDFSEASFHAARYAAVLTSELSASRVILCHAIQPPPVASEIPMPPPYNEGDLYESGLRQLNGLRDELLPLLYSETVIDTHVSDGAVISSVLSFADKEAIDLVVMATSGKGTLEQAFIGSNTVGIIRASPVPVLVIPPQAVIQPLHTIAFASDLKGVRENTPVERVAALAEKFNARLIVFNVSREGFDGFDADDIKEQRDFLDMWSGISAEFHYVNHNDTAEGIMQFAEDYDVQMVIIIPKQRGFFESFFHRSISKQLAYHTRIPLLILNASK